jgi:hypothetical protein
MNQKQLIISQAKRLVLHRERMMKHFGAKNQLKLVSKILLRIDFFSSKDVKCICKVILLMQDDIKTILSGEKSKFYNSDQKKAEELFTLCNEILNHQPLIV